jgi:hypothetical protein
MKQTQTKNTGNLHHCLRIIIINTQNNNTLETTRSHSDST